LILLLITSSDLSNSGILSITLLVLVLVLFTGVLLLIDDDDDGDGDKDDEAGSGVTDVDEVGSGVADVDTISCKEGCGEGDGEEVEEEIRNSVELGSLNILSLELSSSSSIIGDFAFENFCILSPSLLLLFNFKVPLGLLTEPLTIVFLLTPLPVDTGSTSSYELLRRAKLFKGSCLLKIYSFFPLSES